MPIWTEEERIDISVYPPRNRRQLGFAPHADLLGIIERVTDGEGKIIDASDAFIVVIFIVVRCPA